MQVTIKLTTREGAAHVSGILAGFTLLAECYPDNLRFADVSRSGQQSMMDLQLFAEGEAALALSPEQTRQAVAAGTLKPEAPAAQPEVPQQTPTAPEPQPETPAQPERPMLPPLPMPVQNTVRSLHARWAAEEAAMRRSQPGFDLKAELKNPEMRRLMQLPGMWVQDAYRLAHYEDALRTTAQTVERGVVCGCSSALRVRWKTACAPAQPPRYGRT